MEYYYPDYFYDFNCVPGKSCPDSCCHKWAVIIDKETLKKYKNVSGNLGKRMKEKINFETGEVRAHGCDRRCEFLNEDNLCDIILELGEEYLSETCRTHPRHEEVYPNVRERSLAMTCPIACKTLLERREPVRIVHNRKDEAEKEKDRNFDKELFEILLEVRDTMIEIAENRDIEFRKRAIMLLVFANDIEYYIKERDKRNRANPIKKIFIPTGFTEQEKVGMLDLCRKYKDMSGDDLEKENMDKLINDEKYFRMESQESGQTIMTDMLFALTTMEMLNPDWRPMLQSVFNIRSEMTKEQSKKWVSVYHRQEDEIQLEQLLVYFIFVYVCTAAYDSHLLAKCKMSVVNVLLIRELWFMRWLENNEKIDIDDKTEIAHMYVREIENSDENMEQWDSLMQRNPRFALKKLVKMLMAQNI